MFSAKNATYDNTQIVDTKYDLNSWHKSRRVNSQCKMQMFTGGDVSFVKNNHDLQLESQHRNLKFGLPLNFISHVHSFLEHPLKQTI